MSGIPVVLVVEDEWLIRETVAQALRDAGMTVLEASSGEGAIELIKAMDGSLDVLFTDIQLSGYVSGWDVADAVRSTVPGACIVYTSGNVLDTRRQVDDSRFFAKPYVLTDVIEACGTALRPGIRGH